MEVAINWKYGTAYILGLWLGILALMFGQKAGGLAICLLATNVIMHEWTHIYSAQAAKIDIQKVSIFGDSFVDFGIPSDLKGVPYEMLRKIQLVFLSGFYFDFITWFFALFLLWNSGDIGFAILSIGLFAMFVFFNLQKKSDISESIRIEKFLRANKV